MTFPFYMLKALGLGGLDVRNILLKAMSGAVALIMAFGYASAQMVRSCIMEP
jgi:hypothetical protein